MVSNIVPNQEDIQNVRKFIKEIRKSFENFVPEFCEFF